MAWEYLTVVLADATAVDPAAPRSSGTTYTIVGPGDETETGVVEGCSAWIRLLARIEADGWTPTEVPLDGFTFERRATDRGPAGD
jgi:uncharacterized protein (DUF2126 family)